MILFVLGLGLRFLSKIKIFVVNLYLTYQSARLWRLPSLSYSTFFSYLFVSCLLRIQIQKRSYSFLNGIVSPVVSQVGSRVGAHFDISGVHLDMTYPNHLLRCAVLYKTIIWREIYIVSKIIYFFNKNKIHSKTRYVVNIRQRQR